LSLDGSTASNIPKILAVATFTTIWQHKLKISHYKKIAITVFFQNNTLQAIIVKVLTLLTIFRRVIYALLLVTMHCVTKEIGKNKLKGKKHVKFSTTQRKRIEWEV
jgi:hypothetical protein